MRGSLIAAAALVSALALAGCGSGSAATIAPSTSGGVPTAAASVPTPGAANDFSGLDACALIDEATVQGITGESVGFTTQGNSSRNASDCFWGARVAGVPAYVEIRISNSPPDLSDAGIGPGCDADTPVTGVGTEAKGGSCTSSSQRKVYLIAIDQGVRVDIVVNEPNRPLEPADLAAALETVLQQAA